MTIEGLLVALVIIAIICIVAKVFLSLAPTPAPVSTIVWAVVSIVCLLVLLCAVTGRTFISFH